MIDRNIGSVEIGGKYASKSPKQQNHCDCGLYLLHYSEAFLQRPGVLLDGILVRCWVLFSFFLFFLQTTLQPPPSIGSDPCRCSLYRTNSIAIVCGIQVIYQRNVSTTGISSWILLTNIGSNFIRLTNKNHRILQIIPRHVLSFPRPLENVSHSTTTTSLLLPHSFQTENTM